MARPPLYLNARTGALNGITSMTLGNPAVPLDTYIVNNVINNSTAIYDSDRVVATILKNIDPSYIAPSGGGAAAASSGLDSETIINLLFNEGYINAFQLALSSDSDRQELRLEASLIKNDLDSESADLRLKISNINNTLGNVVTTDSVAEIVANEFDGAGFVDSDQVFNMINEHYDSDLIIQTVLKGYNPDAATYDSDLVVNTINKKRGSLILDSDQVFNMINEHSNIDALDSDNIYNMGVEHGWFYDSDKVVDTLGKNFQYVINIQNNNLGKVDSDFVFTMLDSEEVENMFAEHGLAYQSALDSESAEIRILRADVDSLVAGTYNDAPVLARLNDLEQSLDSESARINLALANADSDVVNIAILRRDADSDSIAIQAIKAQADLDSAYITLMRNDLDSDGSKLQALDTRMKAVEAVNTIQVSQINSLTAKLDSDEARLESIDERVDVLELINHLDSDHIIAIINENTVGLTDSDLAVVAKLRSDVDSDSIKIQDLQTQINNLVDDTGFDSDQVVAIINENVTPFDNSSVIARLDSDTIAIQDISTRVTVLEGAIDDTGFDSDQIVAIISENETAFDDSVIVARLDSDSIRIQDLQTQINNIDTATLRADLDSDSTVIQAIRTAVDSDYNLFNTKIALFNGLTDSDLTTVSNLRNDLDSDSIRIQDLQTQINNLVDDTGFDSDQVVAIINENVIAYDDSTLVARLDSDSIKIQLMQGEIDALVAGTYNDAPVIARLDSDELKIQDLQTQLNNLVDDTGFDSDQIESMINEHVTPYDDTNVIARLDSDSIRIQTLQGQVDALEASAYDDSVIVARLDSDEIIIQSLQAQIDSLISNVDSDSIVIQDLQTQINNIDVNDLRARLDSDSTVIQAIRTSVDSDYALFNEKIALFNGLTDSDLTTVSILRNDIDSESLQIRILRADVDSDSRRIQTLQGQVDALEAGTYNDAPLIARLDSDSAVIQSLQTQISSLDSEYVIERTPLRLNNAAFATTSSNQVLDIYDGNEHKTVKYIISAKKGTDWQSSECLINHDGSTAYITEYAIMDSGAGDLYIPDADVSGNDVRLLITPQVTNISVSIVRTQID